MTFDYFQLPNTGIFRGCIPQNIYDSLMSEVKEIERFGSSNTYNHNLVGVIEQEYVLVKSRNVLVPFILKMLEEYLSAGNFVCLNGGITSNEEFDKTLWNVTEMWINFQKKHEYNPTHSHGGDFSFVIWMKLPYNNSDERKVKNVINGKSKDLASTFEFLYTDILGKVTSHCIPVEKGWEGRIVMFPASLNHGVYPFQTSDGYRISISGNLNRVK